MFRVLSDEEASKVIRWQAPDLPVDNPAAQSAIGSHQTPNTLSRDVAVVDASHRNGPEGSESGVLNPSVDMVQAGYDEGYARGFAEGNAALHQTSVKQLNNVIAALRQSVANLDDSELETEIVAMSVDIARMVIKRELSTDPALILEIVKAGMGQLPELSNGLRNIYLNPLDAAIVRELLEEQDAIRILDDTHAPQGSCRIESGASIVRSGVDDWLANVGVQLGLPANDNVPGDGSDQ